MALQMIEAQMTLPDGVTPGKWRQGTRAIDSALAVGCKIYPNPRNKIPDEYRKHILVLDADMGAPDTQPEVRRRGRPRKNAA